MIDMAKMLYLIILA